MSDTYKTSLLRIAESWPKDHLENYIRQLESQVSDIRELVKELKKIRDAKQKEINRKLRDSGPRAGS